MIRRRLVLARLARIGPDMGALLAFARARCAKVGLPAQASEDLVAEAIASVVRGTGTGGLGRKPRRADLLTRAAWLNYLRGAINSRMSLCSRRYHRAGNIGEHPGSGPVADQRCGAQHLQLRDLRVVLFARLRVLAPVRLLPTIDQWEKVFLWSDRIPRVRSHKHVREVRRLARRVLQEIGWDPRG